MAPQRLDSNVGVVLAGTGARDGGGSPGDILTVLRLTRERLSTNQRPALAPADQSYDEMRQQTQYLPQDPIIWHRPQGDVSCQNVSRGICHEEWKLWHKVLWYYFETTPNLESGRLAPEWCLVCPLSPECCQVPSQHLMGSSSEKYASSTKRRPQVMISLLIITQCGPGGMIAAHFHFSRILERRGGLLEKMMGSVFSCCESWLETICVFPPPEW